MVFAKIIFLFSGWNHGIFRSAIVSGFGGGDSVLCSLFFDGSCDRSPHVDFRRSGSRLDLPDMYYLPGGRDSAFLYRNFGAISGENVS